MKLLDQLNPQQKEAVLTVKGPLLVLAGAGSGKTRVVTFRIIHLLQSGVPAAEILGLTFTNKAAGEMRERVRSITNSDVLIATFHSLGARLLRETIHVLGYGRDFNIYDDDDTDKLIKVCYEEMGFSDARGEIKDAKAFISAAKNNMLAPDQLNGTPFASQNTLPQKIYACYQDKLKHYNAVDFDDLLYLPVKIFQEHPSILEAYQERWNYLLIDEYQDTNNAQYKLVKYLVAKSGNICVVGDPDQSIYSWRGANMHNILNFEKDFPGAKVIKLEQNYRSRSNILEAANELISHNLNRFEKELWSDRGPGEKIKHFKGDNERDEAAFVAEMVKKHHEEQNIPYHQMVVFYRTHAQSRAFEDVFFNRRIPYVIVGGISFYRRREIKDILAFLRMVISGSDFISFTRTINLPKRGIGETTLEKIRQGAAEENKSILAFCEAIADGLELKSPLRLSGKQKEGIKDYVRIIRELRAIKDSCTIKELVESAISLSDYFAYLREEQETFDERKENLNALLTKAVEWELTAQDPGLSAFLEELSLKSNLDEADSSRDRVNLMTIHNGKGLEFTAVFLVGMEEDLFPHVNSRDNVEDLEEERRLCYVGMTRAKELLYICEVRRRLIWGSPREQRTSRFLFEIPRGYMEAIKKTVNQPLLGTPVAKMTSKVQTKVADDFADVIDQTQEEWQEPLQEGDAVFHKDFGVGVVKQSYMGSAGLTYKIVFSKDNRERTLIAKFAPLKKL